MREILWSQEKANSSSRCYSSGTRLPTVGILILEDDAGELKSRRKLGKESRKRNVAEEVEKSQGQKWNYCVFDRD